MKVRIAIALLFIEFLFIVSGMAKIASAKEVQFTLEDRDRLIRLEAKLEEIDKRFEQIDTRFEELRMDMNKRFEQMMTFMWMLVVIFTGMTGATIGFAIWDRRTMIRPFEVKVRALEVADQKIMDVLRDLAREDRKLAEVLKNFGLL